MFRSPFYYVAPKESMEHILREGILPPAVVKRMISDGKLAPEVLGISFNGIDTSNFLDFVSLVSDHHALDLIAQQMCFVRHGAYSHPTFMAIGYRIDNSISNHPEFVDETKTKAMNPDSYHSEVLYRGKISRGLISDDTFAVRAR
jgi:hypothetical protein